MSFSLNNPELQPGDRNPDSGPIELDREEQAMVDDLALRFMTVGIEEVEGFLVLTAGNSVEEIQAGVILAGATIRRES